MIDLSTQMKCPDTEGEEGRGEEGRGEGRKWGRGQPRMKCLATDIWGELPRIYVFALQTEIYVGKEKNKV